MSKIEETIKALFTHYLHKPSGETVLALKFPAGYEDRNPNEFEGIPGKETTPVVADGEKGVLQVEPVEQVEKIELAAPVELPPLSPAEDPVPAAPILPPAPVAPAPSAGDTEADVPPTE